MRTLYFLIAITMVTNLYGQNLNKHKWKNRIILIVSKNEESKEYKKQIIELGKSPKEFEERKLVIYQVLPNQYKTIDYQNHETNKEWISSTILYQKYAKKEGGFKIILIGLDGSIKLEKDELLKISELFNIIDSMPMRRTEIERRNN